MFVCSFVRSCSQFKFSFGLLLKNIYNRPICQYSPAGSSIPSNSKVKPAAKEMLMAFQFEYSFNGNNRFRNKEKSIAPLELQVISFSSLNCVLSPCSEPLGKLSFHRKVQIKFASLAQHFCKLPNNNY